MCLQPTAQCNPTALSCTLHAPLTAGGSCRPAARLQLTPRASLRQHPVSPAPHPRGACPVGVPWPSMTATTLSFLRCSTPGPKGRGRTRTSGRPERPALPAPRARSWPGRPRSAAGSAAWTGPAGGQRGLGARRPILWGAQVIPTPAVNPIPTSLGQRRPRREKGLVSETRGPRGCLARVSSTRAPCRSPRGSHRPITPGVPGVPTAVANFKMSRSSTPSFRRSRASRHAFLSLEPPWPCLSPPP